MNFEKLRRAQEHLASTVTPMSDCIVTEAGREVYRHHIRTDGNELYTMWSASKPITVSLALNLYDEGKICLDDELWHYLPEFRYMCVERDDGDVTEAQHPITLRHLFTMTAGLDYNINTPYITKVRQNSRCETRDVVRAIAQSLLKFEPGEHYKYSLCHDVLGAVIETVAGEKLRRYARRVLFEPLGMTDTSYNMPSDTSRLAPLYSLQLSGRVVPTNNTCGFMLGLDYDAGGAGIVSSCSDMARFATMLAMGGELDGYRFLKESTVRMMAENQLNEAQRKDFAVGSMAGYGYGLGVRVLIDPLKASTHAPVGELGWGGAAGTWLSVELRGKTALTYAQHLLSEDDTYISHDLPDALWG